MGLRLTDAVGNGQQQSVDHHADLVQERGRVPIQHEIKQVPETKRPQDEQRLRKGLTAEEASDLRGDAWLGGRLAVFENWRTGRNRRERTNAGAIVIDGGGGGAPADPNPPGPLVRKPPAPDNDTPAWKSWKTAHREAAHNEESAEQSFGPFLSTPRQARRRRYALVETF